MIISSTYINKSIFIIEFSLPQKYRLEKKGLLIKNKLSFFVKKNPQFCPGNLDILLSWICFCKVNCFKYTLYLSYCYQGKYTKAMTDKADYLDKVERLEHVVLQLQGESETIGK